MKSQLPVSPPTFGARAPRTSMSSAMARRPLLALSFALLCRMSAGQPIDAFGLWKDGSLRGANVMQAQCNAEDLGVLRSWGANLAEIPVSNVYAPTPPYAFVPENLAK